MKKVISVLGLILTVLLVLNGCGCSNSIDDNIQIIQRKTIFEEQENAAEADLKSQSAEIQHLSLDDIPDYVNKPYAVVNDNVPFFSETELTVDSLENYSNLDALGRCGVAYANIGIDIMPTEERGSIGMIKPSGWQTIRYENVEGRYLYNRCHLIGFQLAGENANEKNLITGTRYMNTEGMLPFENRVADYVQELGNHVLYRVTPMYEGDNLLASGVLMEGYSVEDSGNGVCFNVFCYNVQPGIIIDYSTGESKAEDGSLPYGSSVVTVPNNENNKSDEVNTTVTYISNKNTYKFHYPSCSSVNQMKEKNKKYLTCARDEVISQGYSPCQRCLP